MKNTYIYTHTYICVYVCESLPTHTHLYAYTPNTLKQVCAQCHKFVVKNKCDLSSVIVHPFCCLSVMHYYESRGVCQLQNLFFMLQELPGASDKRLNSSLPLTLDVWKCCLSSSAELILEQLTEFQKLSFSMNPHFCMQLSEPPTTDSVIARKGIMFLHDNKSGAYGLC